MTLFGVLFAVLMSVDMMRLIPEVSDCDKVHRCGIGNKSDLISVLHTKWVLEADSLEVCFLRP